MRETEGWIPQFSVNTIMLVSSVRAYVCMRPPEWIELGAICGAEEKGNGAWDSPSSHLASAAFWADKPFHGLQKAILTINIV